MRSLLLLTAAVIAVVAGIAALQWSNNHMGATAPSAPVSVSSGPDVNAVDVLVARNSIAVGSVLTEDMLDRQPWPSNLVLEGFITGDAESASVIGKIARAGIQAREPVVMSKLADANEPGFLAATLGKGMRAITLATDAVTGIAGYIFPGDRVDVLFVHNLSGESAVPAVSEVIAPDVRVLAINVREQGAAGAISSLVTGSGGAPSTITVEVSEEMAQKLRLAEKVGTLSLSLRALSDKNNRDVPAPSHLGSLSRSHAGSGNVGGEPVRIIRGVGEAEDKAAVAAPAAGGAAALPGIFGSILR